jgi:hypothetical protein
MNRLLGFGFALLLATAAVLIVTTSSALPPRVASHFAAGGVPNGWQSLESYRATMLTLAIALPVAVVVAAGWLPRRFPRLINLPFRDYWLAPERREATFAALTGFALAIGALVVTFIVALHLVIVAANASMPPRFADGPFWLLTGTFTATIAALVIAYHRRFRVRR